MLKKAPPLRQGLSESRNLPQAPKPGETPTDCVEAQVPEAGPGSHQAGPSSRFATKTTADALEELKGYKEMKDLLLRQGGRSHIN